MRQKEAAKKSLSVVLMLCFITAGITGMAAAEEPNQKQLHVIDGYCYYMSTSTVAPNVTVEFTNLNLSETVSTKTDQLGYYQVALGTWGEPGTDDWSVNDTIEITAYGNVTDGYNGWMGKAGLILEDFITRNITLKPPGWGALNESFEDGVIPAGWKVVDNDGDTYQWEGHSASDAHTGDYVAAVRYNSAGNDDWLITPQLSVSAGDTFSFWAKSASSYYLEDFEVWLSTTGNDISNFTVQLDSVTDVPDTWTHYSYDLSAYDGMKVYLAIRCVSVDDMRLFVDDVQGPSIASPENDVGVVAINEPPQYSYYEQGTDVTINVTVKNFGEYSQTDVPVTVRVTNMQTSSIVYEETKYAEVIGKLQAENITFTWTADTVCLHYIEAWTSLPGDEDNSNNASDSYVSIYKQGGLYESFEGTYPPTYWTSINTSRNGYYAFQGTYSALFSYSSSASERILMTPRMEVESGDIFAFWLMRAYTSYAGEFFRVEYTNGTTWNEMLNLTSDDLNNMTSDWYYYSFDISSLAGQTIQIRFFYNPEGGSNILIDDVKGPTIAPYHNIAVASINAPVDGPAGWQTPNATIENIGTATDTFNVSCKIYKMVGGGTFFSEDFEGSFPPLGWIIEDGFSDDNTWTNDTTSPPPGGSGIYAVCDSDDAGSGVTMDENLTTPSIDCSAYSTVYLEFDHEFEGGGSWYYNRGDIYVKNGTAGVWACVQTYDNGTSSSGHQIIDISSVAADQADVQIKFRFRDFGSWAYYWRIDNVDLSTPPTPTLVYEGNEIVTLDAGEETDVLFAPWLVTSGNYLANVTAWVTDDYNTTNNYMEKTFAITGDTIPPEITNVQANPASQTNLPPNWVNITCDVTDNLAVDEVWVNITYPDSTTHNFTMQGSYYYNDTYTQVGTYNFYIWAVDVEGNGNVSTGHSFIITANSPPDAPTNPDPADGATDVSVNTMLSVDVSDPDGDAMNVYFYWGNGTLIGVHNDVPSGGTATIGPLSLDYNTTYEWYAVADDTMYQTTSPTWQFTTMETPPPYPHLNESFEDGVIPEGWKVVDNDGDGNQWEPYNGDAHNGSWCVRVPWNSAGNDDWLITPKLIISSGDHFTFWAKSDSSYYLEDFEVWLSNTTNDLSSFVYQLADVTGVPNTWTFYSYDLSTWVGQQVYIAIVCDSVDEYYLMVDDIDGCPDQWLPDHDVGVSAITSPEITETEGDVYINATVCNYGINTETFEVNASVYKPMYSQPPQESGWTAVASDAGAGYKAYENFWGVSSDIEKVTWYGLTLYYYYGWYEGDPDGMNFYIEIYEDNSDPSNAPPTNLIASYDVSVNAGDVIVTEVGDWGGYTLYKFEYELPLPVSVSDEDGWLSIQSHDDPDGPDWFLWMSSEVGDSYSYQEGASPPENDFDLSFTFSPDELIWSDEQTVTDLSPSNCTNVSFLWPDAEPGSYNIVVTTNLPGDMNPDNDEKTADVTIVGISDVGVQSINYPHEGDVINATDIVVNATIKNYGTVPAKESSLAEIEESKLSAIQATKTKSMKANEKSFDVKLTVYSQAGPILYYEDFEADDGGYTHDGTNDIWEWGTPTAADGPGSAHSGSNCWGTNLSGDYVAYTDATLDSPAITLPAGRNAYLTFWHWYDTESSYDGGNVKISTDGGVTWNILGSYQDPYNEDAASSSNAGIPGEPCFSGHDQGYWELVVFDLSGYAGNTINLRWHFGSDSSVNYPGWYIDDVAIYLDSAPGVIVYEDTETVPTLNPGETYDVEFDPWSATEGNYIIEVCTQLSGDMNASNDCKSINVTITPTIAKDVGVETINYPVDGDQEGDIPVNATVKNYGVTTETFDVNCSIYRISGKGTKQVTILSEGFEDGVMPPTGWTLQQTNPTNTWEINDSDPHGGNYCASCFYDPDLVPQDEWLITPTLDFSGHTNIELSFWWMMSYYWGVDPNDNYDLNVKISTDGGSTWTLLWNEDTIGAFDNWEWYNTTFGTPIDLSAYAGEPNVLIGFQYEGVDGAQLSLDDITITGEYAGPTPELVYWNEQTVTNLAPDEERYVEFAPWNATPGDYIINVKTLLSGDTDPSNDQKEINVTITSAVYNLTQGENVVDVVNETGAKVTINVTENTTMTITPPADLPADLPPPYVPTGPCVDISVEDESAIVWPVYIQIYYTQADLDEWNLTENQIAGIFYWDGSSWKLYSDTGVNTHNVIFNGTEYEGYAWAYAYEGQLSPKVPGGADTTPPTSWIVPSDIKNGIAHLGTNVKIKAKDDGVWYEIHYIVDNSAERVAAHNTPVDLGTFGEGNHIIEYWAVDAWENEEQHHVVTFYVMLEDKVSQTLHFDGYHNWAFNNWEITQDTLLHFDEDEASELGIVSIWYMIDNTGNWTRYTEPFTVPLGRHSIYFYGIDELGRRTPVARVVVEVLSNEAPTTACILTPSAPDGNNGWYTSDVRIKLAVTDPDGDSTTTKYRIDGGDWKEYMGEITLKESGRYTIQYYSIDSRQGVESVKERSISIDKVAPEITINQPTGHLYVFGREILPLPRERTVVIGKLNMNAEVTDQSLSGIDSIKIYINGELKDTFTEPQISWTWDEFAIGNKEIKVAATDRAGNEASDAIEVIIFNL